MSSDLDDRGSAPRRARRTGPWLAAAALVVLAPAMLAGLLWMRLGQGPVTLPPALSDRIEARIDAAMSANAITIGRIDLLRPEGAGAQGLDLLLGDVRLTDPDGGTRAALPELTVGLSTAALLRGRVHPLRVDVAGAGLRLARDAEGRIDLALTAGDAARELALADTLARLDAMLAAPQFAQLEEIAGTGLELQMADEMTEQVMRVRDARFALARRDGALRLSVGGALEGSRDATLEIELSRAAAGAATELALEFEGVAARDVATIGPALAWVDLMRAPISGSVVAALQPDGALGDLAVALRIGAGRVALDAAGAPLRFDAISAGLRFDAATGRITFDRFDLSAPELSFAAQGHADVSEGGDRLTAQLRLSQIALAPAGLFPAPLALDGAVLDLRLTLGEEPVVEIGQAVIHDAGLELRARGRIAARSEGLELAVDAHIPEADARTVLGYWPEAAIPVTRRWLAENVIGGQLTGVDFALRRAPGAPPEHELSLDFAGVGLQALQSLPPIEGASGYLNLAGPRLILRIDEGRIVAPEAGPIALDGSVMMVPDTRIPGPPARLELAVAGELPDLLRLLRAPPVRLFAEGGMTADRLGRGRAELTAAIDTRLMRQDGMEGTSFRVTGRVSDYASEGLIPGRLLEASTLGLEVEPDALRITGQARLDGVPFSGSFRRAIGPAATGTAQVEARARVTRARLDTLGVALPAWMMGGETAVDLSLALVDGEAPVLTVVSDLAGASLSVPPLGWGKPAAATGRLEATARLGDAPELTALELSAGALSLAGRARLRAGGALDRLELSRLRVGDWLDVTGALVARGAGRLPEIRVTGGTLDLRGAPQGQGPAASFTQGASDGVPIIAALDRLQVTQGIALTGLVADLTAASGISGQFRGAVNGEAPVSGTLVATEAGPALRLRAADGGAVLRAAGVFRSAYGGAMELVLQATGAEGTYDGRLTVENPRLRDAPVMAELLNLVSVVGLIEQLSGEGINLGAVEARFRLTPTEVIVQEGVAFGAALGLSMDGRYILGAQVLDMAGVISPLNAVNGLFGAIFSTRREGLFGFAYRLTGPVETPQVTVNPLSILTPGVFRDIFRRPPPTLPDSQ
ncbi:hypothetical protein [Roseicyclus amphidinii]|uniref:YhdP family protein n=1 Tax=Roseicyclus amphidinii TaxID=3034232 RepID=UPI0024E0FFC7|nr:hypothetical protein [Roseicyclus sp. Amp-Y-6]